METTTLAILALCLSAVTCVAVLILLAIVLGRRHVTPSEVGAAISDTWVRLQLGEVIGRVSQQAEEIRQTHRTLEQMLRSPAGRGSFGELSLEVLLSDRLPKSYFGIRETCVEGTTPDAHIKSPDGLICIDSKFPAENFARWCACQDGQAREALLKQFLKDTDRHLKKVADDYVRPQHGTAQFALVYIPSEAVYYTLATEGYDLLQRYVGRGVQVVSPLLLGHKLEVLKLSVRALRLNENAKEVLHSLQGLGKRFATLEEEWRIFHTQHLRNLAKKADDLDKAYKRLHMDFNAIATDSSPTESNEVADQKMVRENLASEPHGRGAG
jgi:DNA recombination protein RmuC